MANHFRSKHYQTEENAAGLRATVPARPYRFMVRFLSVWLAVWAIGEAATLGKLLSPEGAPFDSSQLAGFWVWTLVGVLAALMLLWQKHGREIITVNNTMLLHRVEIFGIGITAAYPASQLKALRVIVPHSYPLINQGAWWPPFYGFGKGLVAFDYGARTVRIASSLNRDDAAALLQQLSTRLRGDADGR
jgi:hypothetical protein